MPSSKFVDNNGKWIWDSVRYFGPAAFGDSMEASEVDSVLIDAIRAKGEMTEEEWADCEKYLTALKEFLKKRERSQ